MLVSLSYAGWRNCFASGAFATSKGAALASRITSAGKAPFDLDQVAGRRIDGTIAFEEARVGMSGIRIAVLPFVFLADAQVALASKQQDDEMNDLAKARGCYLCHRVEPRRPGGQETLPLGPAWKDVARKYRSLDNATERLTRIVLEGSGSYPGDRHWKGKAKEAQMPPNAVEISEAEAKNLVRWILTLDK